MPSYWPNVVRASGFCTLVRFRKRQQGIL